MQSHLTSAAKALLVGALAISCCQTALCAAKTKAPSTVSAGANAPAAIRAEIPKSVFVIPSSPKEGRNPFFPQSAVQAPPPDPGRSKPPVIPDTSLIVVNGITPPPSPRPTAMINSRTFEEGEPGEIKLPNGVKVLIKCIEIKADSVIIEMNGQKQELKFKPGL